MDRSFLSNQAVVIASRRFVCARLATYEDSEESKLLKSLVRTRSGELENSVFAILGPDGTTQLIRPGRSMRMAFQDAGAFATGLGQISGKYPGAKATGDLSLPVAANFSVGLTVAAADSLPLVVLPPDASEAMVKALQLLAWSPALVGQLQYARLKNGKELEDVKKAPQELKDILVVLPDTFAQGGEVVASLKAGESEGWEKVLRGVVAGQRRQVKTMRDHIPEGKRQGVFYDPANAVTDPMELRARERNRPIKP